MLLIPTDMGTYTLSELIGAPGIIVVIIFQTSPAWTTYASLYSVLLGPYLRQVLQPRIQVQ